MLEMQSKANQSINHRAFASGASSSSSSSSSTATIKQMIPRVHDLLNLSDLCLKGSSDSGWERKEEKAKEEKKKKRRKRKAKEGKHGAGTQVCRGL